MEREQGPEEQRERQEAEREAEERGVPGGGKGRRETPGRSGVYPVSGPPAPSGEAVIHGEASWGQGERGAAGYEDHGGSELENFGGEKGLGGATAGPSGEPEGERWTPEEREAGG